MTEQYCYDFNALTLLETSHTCKKIIFLTFSKSFATAAFILLTSQKYGAVGLE
jgi:hypothetical protein